MRVLADTNIILRLVAPADPQHGLVQQAVLALQGQGDDIVMAFQNVAEFWNICTRPAAARGGFGLTIAEADRRLGILETLFPLLDDTPAAYPIWRNWVVTLAVQGVQVHDTRLAALMQAHGVTHILSLNFADFRRFPGITPIDPATLVPPPPPPTLPAVPVVPPPTP